MSGEFDEIWALYADDGAQSLDAMETSLTRLRAEPEDTEAVGSLFRAMHTFKGNSRMLGLAAIEAVAHAAEDLVGLVRDEGVVLDAELSELLLEAMDVLRGMMEEALSARADAGSVRADDLLNRMKTAYALRRLDASASAPTVEGEEDAPTHDEAFDEVFTEAMIFDEQTASFAEDPLYREIFFDLVKTSLAKIADICAEPRDESTQQLITAELAEIRESALRIGFVEWPARADAAVASVADPEAFAVAVRRLHEALHMESGAGPAVGVEDAPPEESAPPACCAEVPAMVLEALSAVLNAEPAEAPTSDACHVSLEIIEAWAQDAVLPGIADACYRARHASDTVAFVQAAFSLADGIGRLEGSDGAGVPDLIGAWCARDAAARLCELSSALQVQTVGDWSPVLGGLHMFAVACRRKGWGASEEATHALAEMIGRLADRDMSEMPPAFVRLVATFVETARALWEAGATPECGSLMLMQRLLQETVATAGVLVGVEPAAIEPPAGLPPELAMSLSAECLAAIEDARARKQRLHVIRADIAEDEALGTQFAAWLMETSASSIASATIFEDNRTLFDFLVATECTAAEVDASLLHVDPEGKSVYRSLTLDESDDAADERGRISLDAAAVITLREAIGSFAVAHACIRQTLDDCIEADIPSAIDSVLGSMGRDMSVARDKIGHLVGTWQQKLQQLIQVEVQASIELERLTDLATQSASTAQTASVIDAMVVRVEEVQYVLPFHAIDQIVTFPSSRIVPVAAAGSARVIGLQNGEFATVLDLRRGTSAIEQGEHGADDDATVQIVVTRAKGHAVAVLVDELVGQQTVHPRPLSGYLDGMHGVAGYAILKTGDIGMLLDVGRLSLAA